MANTLDRAEAAMLRGAIDEARAAFAEGMELSERNDEFLFWGGLALSRIGEVDQAVELLAEAIRKNPAWRIMLERLPAPLQPPEGIRERLSS